MSALLPALLLIGCSGDKGPVGTPAPTSAPAPAPGTTPPGSIDEDLDGYALPFDCDDTDPEIHPEATDAPYDGVDADCEGDSDYDADGDGFDSDDYDGTDCDDTADHVFPGGEEVCDGRDGDCDGDIDSPVPAVAEFWYLDEDGDGQGSTSSVFACSAPPNHVATNTDCNDSDPTTWLGAPTIACDGSENDCDTSILETSAGGRINGVAYASLNDALAAASPGDVVEICEGRQNVSDLTIGTPITLRGMATAEETVLDGMGLNTLLVAAADFTLEDVTLTGGTGSAPEGFGGALYVAPGVIGTASRVLVTDNRAAEGGGIYIAGGASLTLDDVEVTNNIADLCFSVCSGGGVSVGVSATLLLEGATISGNQAGFCAGVDVGFAGTVAGDPTTPTEITVNIAALDGGGVCLAPGSQLSDVEVSVNQASIGAGIWADNGTVVDVDILTNGASLDGGGMYLQGANVLERVLIDGNSGLDGGGLYLSGSGTSVTVIDGVLSNNVAVFFGANGGAAALVAGSLTSINTDWSTAGSDNSPHDVSIPAFSTLHDETGVASFACDGGTGLCQ